MTGAKPERLLSLDAFRGITMFLLVAEGAQVYRSLGQLPVESPVFKAAIAQFHHHPWHGLRFWDLVQPFFMFIVGVAMAFSLTGRRAGGDSWRKTFQHVGKRCLILLLLGTGIQSWYRGALVWELWNVLSQLSVTVLIAFLVFHWPARAQLAVSFGLLALTELLYRVFSLPGFDQPFVQGHNFGSWMDLVLMGKLSAGGWVAINAIPTAAHTIWGVLAGQLLMGPASARDRLRVLAIGAAIGLLVGYGLDLASVTPIIKRICTSSFVLVSGGWCLVALSFLYWLIDLRGKNRWPWFFTIVGMNPIFIYVFFQIGGEWFNQLVGVFAGGLALALGASPPVTAVVASLAALMGYWSLCHWLYRHRIFIRI